MNFAGKWMKLGNIILREVIQTQNYVHGIYSQVDIGHRVQNNNTIIKEAKYNQPKEANNKEGTRKNG